MAATSIRRIHISDYATVVVKPLDAKIKEMLVQLMPQLEIPAQPTGHHTSFTHSHTITRGGGGADMRGGGRSSSGKTRSNVLKRDDVLRRGIRGPQEVRDIPLDNWEAMRNFKATKMETKMGIDKIISEVRILINKISKANAEQQKIRIIQTVRDYYADSEMVSEENTGKLVSSIFDIVCSNKLMCDIYAGMYGELMEENDDFNAPIESFVDNFIALGTIAYVDPDENYDGYCLYNKAMDKRKSSISFAIACMQADLIGKSDVSKLLGHLITETKSLMVQEGNEKVVEEYAEMVYIVIHQAYDELVETAEWESIFEEVGVLSTTKAKSFPSISNRAIFKYKDIVDMIRRKP